jgi:hypothetical protein
MVGQGSVMHTDVFILKRVASRKAHAYSVRWGRR